MFGFGKEGFGFRRMIRAGAWALLTVSLAVVPLTASASGPLHVIVDAATGALGDTPLPPFDLSSQNLVVVCCRDAERADSWRRHYEQLGRLGKQLFVVHADPARLPLADGLADSVEWRGAAPDDAARRELTRVAHFSATVRVGDEQWVVPRPDGADDWSHPYHGPDNNPMSRDEHVRGSLMTQFLSEPWYVPMPEVTVASGGRIFKAFGHIALKEREWPWLNKLVAINGFNGLQLWTRDLQPGFNIHRNTLIATPKRVYLADNDSCKVLDASTGELVGEIKIPPTVDSEGSWKWMALRDGVLYAIVGERETLDEVIQGKRDQPGWPWNGLGDAYAGKNRWGIGRTVVALRLDADPPRVLWSYRSQDSIDSRAACMWGTTLYVYSPRHSLTALDTNSGVVRWRSADQALLEAIGEDDPAQTPRKGFSTSSYAKANRYGVYFAGPQRRKLVAVSAVTGKLMWTYPHGNFQLVLRDDGLYAMGRTESSKVFDYVSGKVLEDLQCFRGNCTRATATLDTIYTRGYRHTGTMQLDLSGRRPKRIPLMRPACQDGVIIADGRLYWGPWMCDCNHSLVGMICLAPVAPESVSVEPQADQLERFREYRPGPAADERDWPQYRHDRERRSVVSVAAPDSVQMKWRYQSATGGRPTAPIVVGSQVIWGGRDGIVRAVERTTGKLNWQHFTEGPLFFPPEFSDGHVYVGSGDGRVTCLNAEDGTPVWRYRVAPQDRRILVHGKLMSNWPVGSGVLVDEDTVFAAAGISSYDGTFVVALDKTTGAPRWRNDTSDELAGPGEVTGVSVQGHLLRYRDRLYLAGGNVVSPAVYDVASGKCLNSVSNPWSEDAPPGVDPISDPNPRGPYLHAPRGRELFVVNGQVRVFDQLLYSPPTYMRSRYQGGHFLQAGIPPREVRATTDVVMRLRSVAGGNQPAAAWRYEKMSEPVALAVTANAVLVAGQVASLERGSSSPEYALVALDFNRGGVLWEQELPARPCSWGIAVGRNGEIVVTLESGELQCWAGE